MKKTDKRNTNTWVSKPVNNDCNAGWGLVRRQS